MYKYKTYVELGPTHEEISKINDMSIYKFEFLPINSEIIKRNGLIISSIDVSTIDIFGVFKTFIYSLSEVVKYFYKKKYEKNTNNNTTSLVVFYDIKNKFLKFKCIKNKNILINH